MAEQEKQEPRSRRDMEDQIIAKAWADEAFMEELRTDPRAAISAELGADLPENLTIIVHEESRSEPTWHLVVPPAPRADELDDDELDAVAGGCGPYEDWWSC